MKLHLFVEEENILGLAIFVFQAHLLSCPEKERATQERLVEPLMSLVKSYEGGRESHARVIVQSLFEEYLSVEEIFSENIEVCFTNYLYVGSCLHIFFQKTFARMLKECR